MRKKHYYYWEALISLLIVGLGQIIKGEGKKGVALLLGYYLVIPATIYLALLITGFIFPYLFCFLVILAIILWGYSIFDALMER